MSRHRLFSAANLLARSTPCSAHRPPPSSSPPHLGAVIPPSRSAVPTPHLISIHSSPFLVLDGVPKSLVLFSSHCLSLSAAPIFLSVSSSRLSPDTCSHLASLRPCTPASAAGVNSHGGGAISFSLLPSSISLPSLTLTHFLGFFRPLLIKNSELGAQDCSILDEMDLFHGARLVRLRSHLDKFLTAEDDLENVCQDRQGDSYSARWTVELVDGSHTLLRLKSCYGRYLTASNKPFFLGVAGRKVLQTAATRLDSSVEWEPIREGFQVMLKTHDGRLLRANGGLPPWRNSVTHHTPHCSITSTWILWDVHITLPSPSTAPSVALDPPLQPDRASLSSLPSDVSEVS